MGWEYFCWIKMFGTKNREWEVDLMNLCSGVPRFYLSCSISFTSRTAIQGIRLDYDTPKNSTFNIGDTPIMGGTSLPIS